MPNCHFLKYTDKVLQQKLHKMFSNPIVPHLGWGVSELGKTWLCWKMNIGKKTVLIKHWAYTTSFFDLLFYKPWFGAKRPASLFHRYLVELD